MHLRESIRFGPLVIEYDDRVLRPRPWTALQSQWACELLVDAPDGPVLELCSGAGHIGLLAAAESGRALVAVDVDSTACRFFRLNAEGAGLTHRVDVRERALEEAVGETEVFSLVLADPPWVSTTDVGRYPEDPLLAIDGGSDGLDVAWACIEVGERHVAPGGSVLVQLGNDEQCDRVLAAGGDRHRLQDGGRRHGEGGVVLRLVRPQAGPATG